MWLTSLDDRVRDSHRGAHGQQVGLDEPFIVGGNACEVPGECGVAEDDGGVANERGALRAGCGGGGEGGRAGGPGR